MSRYYWPRINFGGWFTTEEPAEGVYYKELPFENGMDVRVLHFPDLQVVAHVFINGQFVETVNPFAPFMDISALSSPGGTAMIAVATEQHFHRQAGQILLYQGKALQSWEVAGWDENKLTKWVKELNTLGKGINFPIELVGGEMVLLRSTLPSSVDWDDGWALQVIGRGLKASAWLGERLIGRLWLPSGMRPRMAGGADDRLFLPAEWIKQAGGLINLLLESVDSTGILENVNLILDS